MYVYIYIWVRSYVFVKRTKGEKATFELSLKDNGARRERPGRAFPTVSQFKTIFEIPSVSRVLALCVVARGPRTRLPPRSLTVCRDLATPFSQRESLKKGISVEIVGSPSD